MASEEEVSSPDESFPRAKRLKIQTSLEIVSAALKMNKTKSVDFCVTEDKGRGVKACEKIEAGDFVLEYKYSTSYVRKERHVREKEYILNEEGCFIMEVQLPGGKWLCLDATGNTNSWGRYINHSPPSMANIRPFRPLMVRGKWRVGFTAVRDICVGEELLYSYGQQANPPDWMKIKHKPGLSIEEEKQQPDGPMVNYSH